MRGPRLPGAMFSYISLEERVPQAPPAAQVARGGRCAAGNHEQRVLGGVRPPWPPIGAAGDAAQGLAAADPVLHPQRAPVGRSDQLQPAVPLVRGPEHRRQGLEFNHLQRQPRTSFNEDLARAFFERVTLECPGALASDEHFSVDGTLIDAWASYKASGKGTTAAYAAWRNPEVDFKRSAATTPTRAPRTPMPGCSRRAGRQIPPVPHGAHPHGEPQRADRGCRDHHASGTAERERHWPCWERRGNRNKRATVGADKGYDSKAFIKAVSHKVTPHVAAGDKHSAVDAQ